jgi:hypothetical protein
MCGPDDLQGVYLPVFLTDDSVRVGGGVSATAQRRRDTEVQT